MAVSLPKGTSGLDIDKAVKYLDDKAEAGSTGHCAKYVRLALEAGGLSMSSPPLSAKDYGPYLVLKGFVELSGDDSETQKGNVCVIQNYIGSGPHGHIQMFDGDTWVSDFKNHPGDIWPGPGYRAAKPAYVIYQP